MYCIVIVLYCYPIYYPCALTVSLTNIITFLPNPHFPTDQACFTRITCIP